jgi:3-keto-L-gulonate-6-phosphate decarboxylase
MALSGPTFVYGDNISVVHNTLQAATVLKKKSNSIFYHAVRDSAAMGESIIGNVSSVDNPADICTKSVSGGHKQNHLIRLLLHDFNDIHLI